jgi:hypothetical protein
MCILICDQNTLTSAAWLPPLTLLRVSRAAPALVVPSMNLGESRNSSHPRAPVAQRKLSAVLGAAFRNAGTMRT